MVHFKSEYGSLGEAVKQSDGLAVLGVMFEVSQMDNTVLSPIIDAFSQITEAGNYLNDILSQNE